MNKAIAYNELIRRAEAEDRAERCRATRMTEEELEEYL